MTATDPTAVALLAAIRAAPADDAPRMVYADWLEEHADARRPRGGRCRVDNRPCRA